MQGPLHTWRRLRLSNTRILLPAIYKYYKKRESKKTLLKKITFVLSAQIIWEISLNTKQSKVPDISAS